MKKIFFLTALLCASMMSFAAVDYCDAAITSETKGNKATVTMRLVGGNFYEFSVTTEDNIVSFNTASNFYANVNGVGGYSVAGHLTKSGNTLSVQFESSVVPSIYANDLFIELESKGENQFKIPMDASWAACGATKNDPELSLNATDKILDASTSETFQIVATQSGDGAISYESSDADIASVSETGLVTAKSQGIAEIVVKTAETATCIIGTKKLTVVVTNPINWDPIAWLKDGGEDSKYKLVCDPEIADVYGGKRIEGTNMRIGFPAAIWGDNSSIDHTLDGAAVLFPLSQFTEGDNNFIFRCNNVIYVISLYYAGASTGVEGVQSAEYSIQKTVENGQLVIIKNGVKFNVAGQEIK